LPPQTYPAPFHVGCVPNGQIGGGGPRRTQTSAPSRHVGRKPGGQKGGGTFGAQKRPPTGWKRGGQMRTGGGANGPQAKPSSVTTETNPAGQTSAGGGTSGAQ
jgi:hypothetical protein